MSVPISPRSADDTDSDMMRCTTSERTRQSNQKRIADDIDSDMMRCTTSERTRQSNQKRIADDIDSDMMRCTTSERTRQSNQKRIADDIDSDMMRCTTSERTRQSKCSADIEGLARKCAYFWRLHANKRDAEKDVSFFCALATEISEESPKIEMANGNKTVKVSGIKSTTINRTALCKQVFLLAALDTNEEFTSALDVANYNARILDAEGLLCGYNKVCFAGYRNVIPLCGLHVVSLILKKHLTVKDMNRAIYETTAMLRASGNFTEDICSWNYQPGVINSGSLSRQVIENLLCNHGKCQLQKMITCISIEDCIKVSILTMMCTPYPHLK
jgi:hypothetical protein